MAIAGRFADAVGWTSGRAESGTSSTEGFGISTNSASMIVSGCPVPVIAVTFRDG
jgi:hypothetical protein